MKQFDGNPNALKNPSPEQKDNSQRPKIKVVTENVSARKESEFKKFKNNFFAEDAKTVKKQIFMDIFIPGIQKLITDAVKYGIDILVYGTKRPKEYRSNDGRGGVSWTSYASDRGRSTSEYNKIPEASYDSRKTFSLDDVTFFERGEAEETLTTLQEHVNTYGMVSVADFYDSIGRTTTHTANRYGWRDLSTAAIVRTRNGYSIDFPKISALD
jgi:hypothetical protein